LRVGPTHVELHPFRWDDIRQVEPLTPGTPAVGTVSLAAPLHEEQYLGDWKWAANELAGVAGHVYLEEGSDPAGPFESNYHTAVGARLELDPPPRVESDATRRLMWSEEVTTLGQGMSVADTRTVQQRPDGGLVVQVTIFARSPGGGLASIYDPGQNQSVFQARYELRWERVWDDIGHANDVVAMAAANGKLFAATRDNRLWWRDPVGADVNWDHIGHANDVVAMAAANEKLFAATRDNRLWWRDPVGADVNWDHIGHANNVVAMAGLGQELFACTQDNRLWRRPALGS
jgi:hypothetical protein